MTSSDESWFAVQLEQAGETAEEAYIHDAARVILSRMEAMAARAMEDLGHVPPELNELIRRGGDLLGTGEGS